RGGQGGGRRHRDECVRAHGLLRLCLAEPGEPAMNAASSQRAGHIAGTAFLWAAVVVAVLPLTLMAINSLKLHVEILANPLSLPTWFNVTNFVQAWTAGNFTTGLINS